MKRKKDIMSFFQRKDSETEPNGSGVERARESRERAEREQEDLSDGVTESEGTVEQESETDGETEAEGDIEAESEIPIEEPRTSTSSGPSDIGKSQEEPLVQPMMNIYPRTLMGDSDVNTLNKEHNKQVQENRDYIKTIGEVLLLTATQNIAQRGHDEPSESDNKGNFMAILETIAKHDTTVKKRLTSIPNATYTSKGIQNEVLSCLADMVRTQIIEEVKDSEVFSIMVDETKDVKKKEQISLVIRYYFSGAVHESFLHFESADRLDAAGLTDRIINILESHGLEYKNNLVGQAYDGASVMSGKHSCVQARIKEQAKHAFYIHSSAQCSNLVLVETVKGVPEVGQFFSLLERLYVFTSGSYVHQKWLSIQKEMYPGAPRELQILSDPRWACRYMTLHTIIDRLPAIKRVLQDIVQEHNSDGSVEARGLLAQMDLQFIVCLVTLHKVFGEATFVSDMLQSPSLDPSKAVGLVEALVQTLNDYRDESFFDDLWNEVSNTAQQCDTATHPCKTTKKATL